MTIQVISNEKPAPEAPEAKAEGAKSPESADVTKSAPEAKAAPEQEDTEESDTSETDATDGDEADQVDADQKDGTESKDGAKEEKSKKKGGFQRRIDKLNARQSQTQAELEYWKQQALKGAGGANVEKPVESKPQATEGKPIADSFETHAEYVEALTDWKTEQKLREREQRAERAKIEAEQAKVVNSYSERAKTFAAKTDDFQETLENVDDIPLSPAVAEIIFQSENGPELAYELAKSRDEYKRICSLSPLAAAREMGKIEARLAANAPVVGEKSGSNKITKAPKPLDPVTAGKGSTKKSLNDPNLTQAEYEQLRREQIKRRQG